MVKKDKREERKEEAKMKKKKTAKKEERKDEETKDPKGKSKKIVVEDNDASGREEVPRDQGGAMADGRSPPPCPTLYTHGGE